MKTPSDITLYRRWASGCRPAGEQLIRRFLPIVSRFFANKVAGQDLEDLVSTTFERCATSLGRFRGEGRFRAYLLGIAVHTLHDHLRVRYAATVLEWTSVAALQPSPSSVLAAKTRRERLREAARRLSVPLQLVFELRVLEGISRAETAVILGVAEGTVASRLRRAKQAIAQLCGAKATDEGKHPTRV